MCLHFYKQSVSRHVVTHLYLCALLISIWICREFVQNETDNRTLSRRAYSKDNYNQQQPFRVYVVVMSILRADEYNFQANLHSHVHI